MKTRVIALSAISSAFVAISLILGAYISLIDLFSLVVASVFVILPLYYKSYVGCFMTYLVGGIIAFLASGFNIMSVVFPAYFAFAGLYPIIKFIAEGKKLNKYILWSIGMIWTVGAFFGIYFYYTLVMKLPMRDLPLWIQNNIYLIIGLLGIVFYFVFDKFLSVMKMLLDKLLGKIIKKR